MNRLHRILLISILFISSCKQKQEQLVDANQIVNKSIEVSGGKKIANSTINFDFRDKHYKAIRSKGVYKLERYFKDSVNTYSDVLSNSGFKRFIKDELIEIPDSMASKYSNSVNSVHYFSVLPFGLNDDAVNKSYIGLVELKGNNYHKIKVTFDENGGGDDFEDVFVYWINANNFKVDFLAYSYHVNGGGMRFREAFNERIINGIRFVDYNNYKTIYNDISLLELDKQYETNKLKLLSKIELKNIEVE